MPFGTAGINPLAKGHGSVPSNILEEPERKAHKHVVSKSLVWEARGSRLGAFQRALWGT